MGTFKQYVKSASKSRKTLNYYYVCGDFKRAIEYVLADIVSKIRPASDSFYVFDLEDHTFSSIFSVLSFKTVNRRLFIIRNAQIIAEPDWEKVRRWAGSSPATTLIFVTNETSARSESEDERYRWFMQYGKFIQCRKFPDKDSTKEFIMEFLHGSEILAEWIMDTVGAEPETLLSELIKIKLSGYRTVKDIQFILPPKINKNYLELLYNKDPQLMKNSIPLNEFKALLDDVEKDLINQAATIGLARKNMKPYEIAGRLNIKYGNFGSLAQRATKTNANELAARLDLISKTQDLYNKNKNKEGLALWFLRAWRKAK